MDVKPEPLSTLKNYNPSQKVRGYVYDMSTYMKKNVDRYCNEAMKGGQKLKHADTPFLDESREPLGCTVGGDADIADQQPG